MTAASEALESAAPSREHRGGLRPSVLSGRWPLLGHVLALRSRPIELFQRVRDELGEMMQLRATFSDLLRSYEFELAQPPESYRNDHSKMVVQLQQPCRVRYARRKA